MTYLAKESDVKRALFSKQPMIVLLYKEALNTNVTNVSLPSVVVSLLQEYDDVFPDELPKGLPPIRGIEHQIDFIPGATIPNRPAYRSNPEETKELQRQVDELLKKGFVKENMNSCAIPEFLLPQKNRTWKLSVDFQKVNKSTVMCYYPSLCLDNMFYELHDTCDFSKIGFQNDYYQFRIKDEWKVALTYDLYKCLVISIRLTNASSFFMSLLKHVLHASIGKFVFNYFDDSLIFIVNYGGYLIYIELVHDHAIQSRGSFQNSCFLHSNCYLRHYGVHDIRSSFSCQNSYVYTNRSINGFSSLGSDCDMSFPLDLVSLHNSEFANFYGKRMDNFVEFTHDRNVNSVIAFSSCEIGCDLLISLTPLFDIEYVNVDRKRKVGCVVQIRDVMRLNTMGKIEQYINQPERCIEHLKGSVLIFDLGDYAYNFEFLDFLVITHKIHIDWFRFIFDPGALNWVYLQMDEIIRLIFDPGGDQI